MRCDACNATFEVPSPVTSGSAAVKLLLRDWRVWAFAVGAMVAAAMLSVAFGGHFGGGGAGGGAVTGLFIAFRMRSLRVCPACGAPVRPEPAAKSDGAA